MSDSTHPQARQSGTKQYTRSVYHTKTMGTSDHPVNHTNPRAPAHNSETHRSGEQHTRASGRNQRETKSSHSGAGTGLMLLER
ncbi:Hypothetical predicted protein [Pelobates cultripes]|uniref:Uncharacterized protein n=1 Tax=Pelobates cultripes TaxID=61616 RepID=A0AAD1RNY0_PELCU|nr:Hypothetical predicted protein [Pelobates cultripes]